MRVPLAAVTTLAWRNLWRNYRRTLIMLAGDRHRRVGHDFYVRPDAWHDRRDGAQWPEHAAR